MTSKIKTSLITASFIAVASAFTGCGSSSSATPDPVVDTKNVADGYIIDLNGTAATAFCSDTNTTYTSSLTVGAKGAITFSGVTLGENCTITVGANAFIDANSNGDFDTNDTQVGFALRAPGDAQYVSQLTTLVVDKKAKADAETNTTKKAALLAEAASLKTAVKSFDPVTAATTVASTTSTATAKNTAQKLMVLSEVLKTAMKSASSSDVADINATTFTNDSNLTDLNVTATLPTNITSNATTKAAIEAKAKTITSVATILTQINPALINVDKFVVAMSDGDANLTTALNSAASTGTNIDDTNLSNIVTTGEINTTTISEINTAVTAAVSAVDSLPAKLTLGTTLKMGSKTITLVNGKFTTTASKDDNLTNFFAIELPSATVNKVFDEQNLTLTVTVTNSADTNDVITLALSAVKLDDSGNSVTITIPRGTDVNITEVVNNTTRNFSGTTGSNLTNTDLKFNINSIINTLGTNTVNDGIAAMNTRLATSAGKSYDVNITLGGLVETGATGLTTDYKTITGTVTVTE